MFTNYEITGAFKRSSIYGSAIQVDPDDYIFFISETLLKERVASLDLSLSEDFIECADLSNIQVIGDLITYLHFSSSSTHTLEWLLFLAMGNNTLTPLNAVVGDRNLNLSANIEGKFGTLALNKILSVHEFQSVTINGFRIFGLINNIMQVQLMAIANNRTINSTINTPTVLKTVELQQQTDGDVIIPISLRYGKFLIDDLVNPLSTEYGITSFDFMFKRNISGDWVANGNEPLEPQTESEHEIELEIILPYYNTNEFINDFDLQTFKHSKLEFIGPTIIDGLGNSYRHSFIINFNKMKIINEEDIINNAGLQPLTLKFICLDDNVNGPFDIDIRTNNLETFN